MSEHQARWGRRVALVLLFLAILLPRIQQLDLYATADEDRWLRNSANFYYALARFDAPNTYQLHHPGVTTMWAGTAGLLVTYPEYYRHPHGYFDDAQYNQFMRAEGIDQAQVLAASRFFMALGTSLLLLLSFWLAEKIIGFWPAYAGILLAGLDPFYISLTRLLHLDGLLTSFILAAVLAFFVYLFQGRKRGYFILSGVLGGLALLTKSPALFLLPFIGLMLLLDLVWRRERDWREWTLQGAKRLGGWVLLSLGTFIGLWPAMWVDLAFSVSDYFFKAFIYAADTQHMNFYQGVPTFGSQLPAWFYLETILWRTSPVILIGLALAVIAFIRQWALFKQEKARRLALVLVFFILAFTLFLQLSDKKFDRYLIPVYPSLNLIAALGWLAATAKLKALIQARKFAGVWHSIDKALLVTVFAVQAGLVWWAAPYYFLYYNPLLGGPRAAADHLLIGWGEGLNLAGEYLENKLDGSELQVVSWYAAGPFSFYFSGESEIILGKADLGRWNMRNIEAADYLVVYVNQWQREMNQPLFEVLAAVEPEFTATIQGVEMARVYAVDDLTPDQMTRLWASTEE